MTPDMSQLMALIKETQGKQTALENVANQEVANQPWRQPGASPQNAAQFALGQQVTPAQGRGLNQLYGSILNRKPGQTRIGAASEGFERGSQLIDNIRAKNKAEKVGAAQIGVEGAQQQFKDNMGVFKANEVAKAAEDNRNYRARRADTDRANLALRAGELAVKRGNLGLKTDQEAWKRENPDMSVNTEKVYREYNIQEIDAGRKANKFSALSEQLRKAQYPGGARTWGEEQLKSILGNQDQQTALIEAGRNLTVSEAINSLPPGVASDKDIELVMGTVPSQFADPEYLANYAEARARLERLNAEYATFVQQFMEQNKNKNYSMVGVNTAWKIYKVPVEHKLLLERNADDPEAVEAFERVYGQGMAEKVLAQ